MISQNSKSKIAWNMYPVSRIPFLLLYENGERKAAAALPPSFAAPISFAASKMVHDKNYGVNATSIENHQKCLSTNHFFENAISITVPDPLNNDNYTGIFSEI